MTIQSHIDPETRAAIYERHPGATEECIYTAITEWATTEYVGRWLLSEQRVRHAAMRAGRVLTDEEAAQTGDEAFSEDGPVSSIEAERTAATWLLGLLDQGFVRRRTIRLGGVKTEYWTVTELGEDRDRVLKAEAREAKA